MRIKTLTLILTLLAVALCGGCASAYQRGLDAGYSQRQADDAKRCYWAKQREKNRTKQRVVYYTFDESGTKDAAGQKKPAGTKVSIPVTEPEPVK